MFSDNTDRRPKGEPSTLRIYRDIILFILLLTTFTFCAILYLKNESSAQQIPNKELTRAWYSGIMHERHS